mgnify:CR=1 FL=1
MREIIKIVGLTQFLYCTNAPFVAFAILANGLLCHGSAYFKSSLHMRFKRIDILTNTCLTIYVNAYSYWVPQTQLCSVFAFLMWKLNNRYFNESALAHVLFVQTVLCVALLHF